MTWITSDVWNCWARHLTKVSTFTSNKHTIQPHSTVHPLSRRIYQPQTIVFASEDVPCAIYKWLREAQSRNILIASPLQVDCLSDRIQKNSAQHRKRFAKPARSEKRWRRGCRLFDSYWKAIPCEHSSVIQKCSPAALLTALGIHSIEVWQVRIRPRRSLSRAQILR